MADRNPICSSESYVGSGKGLKVLRDSPLHVRRINRDENNDYGRIDGLNKHIVRTPERARLRDGETGSHIR